MKVTHIFACDLQSECRIPLVNSPVVAGFPSPADDDIERMLDLNQHLIKHPAATFFVRVQGDSMEGAHICEGDILIVDRSLLPREGKIVVAIVDNQFTVKRLVRKNHQYYLEAANPQYRNIHFDEEASMEIWGVVTHCIHTL